MPPIKLKTLPSTLRESKRYLAVEIISEDPLKKEDIVSIIWSACLRLYGECLTSNFRLWLIKAWKPTYNDESYNLKCIIQCKRGEEDKVRAALSSIYQHNGARVAVHTLGISGTIRSLTQKFIKPRGK